MKRIQILVIMLTAAICAFSQSLNVRLSNGATYSFPGNPEEDITFDTRVYDGVSKHYVAISGHEFDLSEVDRIFIDPQVIADNNVAIIYSGSSAEVWVAGNLSDYVESQISGANVVIKQSTEVSDTICGEITYTASGSSSDGSLTLKGDYKATLILSSLNLTSLSSAPINIENGKRIALKLTEGTTSSLCDAPGGTHKGTLVCKGHLEFKQKGALEIKGKTAHAIYAKEYVQIKNSSITISEAVKDGINCAQYFLMESGTLNILASGDDGVQVDYKDADVREAEDTGSITIKNGTISILTTADAAKCLKAENEILIQGGKLTLEVRGNGVWDSAKAKTKAAACLSADGNFTATGGELTLTATGSGGKGISTDGTLQIDGGTFKIKTSGGLLVYSNGTLNHNYTSNADRIDSSCKSSSKGMKADGAVVINGGVISILTTGSGGEGIESKSTLTVNDGTINIKAYDDGMNSATDMTIAGGDLTVVSTAGDGLDSNANIIISGGTVRTFGAGGPECGLDASTETGCSVKFTGGTILAAGGGSSAPTSAATTQAFVSVSGVTLTAGTEVAIKSGDTVLATLKVPAYYSSTSTPLDVPAGAPMLRGPGGWPGGGPGGMGSGGTILSAPGMVSGQSYTIVAGNTTTTATAKLK